MKRATTLTGALILALAATSLPVMAQDGQAKEGPRGHRGQMFNFDDVDANGDGKVTQDEIAAHGAARFAAADTDCDGSLSVDEMVANMDRKREERMRKGAERMIERRDANDDGQLTADEMTPRNGDRMFARLDADKDGAISKEEMEDARKSHKGQRKGERGEHGKRGMKPDTSE